MTHIRSAALNTRCSCRQHLIFVARLPPVRARIELGGPRQIREVVVVSSALSVNVLLEDEYDDWAHLVADSPDGSIYATAQYLEIPCRAAGGEFRILGVRRGDRLIGGVPLSERKSFGGNFVGPRLLLYYLGPVLRRHESKYPSQRTAQNVATSSR